MRCKKIVNGFLNSSPVFTGLTSSSTLFLTLPLYTFFVVEKNSHHIKHCEEEEEIVECPLNFLTGNCDEGSKVPNETNQSHGQEQDSLQQKLQHAVDTVIIKP